MISILLSLYTEYRQRLHSTYTKYVQSTYALMLRLMQHPGRHAAAVRGREQISRLVSSIPVTITHANHDNHRDNHHSNQTTTQGLAQKLNCKIHNIVCNKKKNQCWPPERISFPRFPGQTRRSRRKGRVHRWIPGSLFSLECIQSVP